MVQNDNYFLIRITRHNVAMLVFALIFTGFFTSPAHSAISLEHKVKVATIFKLLKFVHWENAFSATSKNSNLNICVIGKHEISKAIDLVNNKQVKGHTIKVFTNVAPESELECHVKYITRNAKDDLPKNFLDDASSNSLTISDIKGFAKSGGMIELAIIDKKIRLIINRQATSKSPIRLSSKLLDIAILIGKNENLLSGKSE